MTSCRSGGCSNPARVNWAAAATPEMGRSSIARAGWNARPELNARAMYTQPANLEAHGKWGPCTVVHLAHPHRLLILDGVSGYHKIALFLY